MTLGGVAMENNKFTKQSVEAIKCAKDLACDLGMNYIGTEHIIIISHMLEQSIYWQVLQK